MAAKKRRASKGDTLPNTPDRVLIIAGDDGAFYKLQASEWSQTKFKVPKEHIMDIAVLKRLDKYGVYLASIPDIARGTGLQCQFVNVKKLMKK